MYFYKDILYIKREFNNSKSLFLYKYNYDFINPEGLIEFIFTGMLLGYPVESTADRLVV